MKLGDHLKKKRILVAQNYSDEEASYFYIKAFTVQIFSQCVTLSIAASIQDVYPYTCDKTQAYIQAHTELDLDVYIRALKDMVLVVVKHSFSSIFPSA